MVDKGLTWVWPGYWAELSQQNNFCATSLCTITYNCRKGILYTLHFTLNRSNALYTLHFTVAMHNAYGTSLSCSRERLPGGRRAPGVYLLNCSFAREWGNVWVGVTRLHSGIGFIEACFGGPLLPAVSQSCHSRTVREGGKWECSLFVVSSFGEQSI